MRRLDALLAFLGVLLETAWRSWSPVNAGPLAASLLIWLLEPAWAEPLYPQAVERARPDPALLAKAREKVKEHREIAIRDDIDALLPHFHKRPEQKVTSGETFCQICHLPLPHQKSVRTRAFLNMHSRFIACATCHFRPKEGRVTTSRPAMLGSHPSAESARKEVALTYRWLDYRSGRAISGEGRFRTGTERPASEPIEGWVKIAPFAEGEPVVPLPSDPWAKEIARRWREGDLETRAMLQAKLHLPLEEKGPRCGACHQEEAPLLDLEKLGASRKQARLIYRHMIPRFFELYKDEHQKIRIIDLTR